MIKPARIFIFKKPGGLARLALLGVLLTTMGVQAEPYLAMRTGFKCSQCHVNRIGGGERTVYGYAYTQYKLLLVQTENLMQAEQGGQTSFNPKLNESVTIGGNFRVEQYFVQKYTYTDNTGAHTSGNVQQANIKEAAYVFV